MVFLTTKYTSNKTPTIGINPSKNVRNFGTKMMRENQKKKLVFKLKRKLKGFSSIDLKKCDA